MSGSQIRTGMEKTDNGLHLITPMLPLVLIRFLRELRMHNKKLLISVLFLTLAAAGNLFAGGSEFNTITDAKTLSLNGLYFAGESGMNSILGNPAGLILLNNKYLEFSVADKIGQ